MDYTQISIIKRDGKTEPFSLDKIVRAITKAFRAGGITDEGQAVEQIASDVAAAITKAEISVEEIQDMVEERLMKRNPSIAKRYIIYREWRNVERDRRSSIKSVMDGIVTVEKNDINLSNANMSSHTPAGQMMTFASEITKDYALKYLVGVRHGRAHRDGDIHIHDLDYYPTKTTTCIQYDLGDIYERGFSTKNGSVRTPQSIQSYATLATIVFQTNQNEQHGGQSIPAFDHFMAPGVLKTFRRHLTDMTLFLCGVRGGVTLERAELKALVAEHVPTIEPCETAVGRLFAALRQSGVEVADEDIRRIWRQAYDTTRRETHQAMEGFIHNLNTMHSRGGNQVVFSSVNYGTDFSPEGRMVIRELLSATIEGLGHGEVPVFPIQIFKVKEGVSWSEEDYAAAVKDFDKALAGEIKFKTPNFDLLIEACRTTSVALFPNFMFLDAPFNRHEKWRIDDPDRFRYEVATMGCRTRVFENLHGEKSSWGRGNLSFTSMNLPRLAIEAMREAGDMIPDGNKHAIRKEAREIFLESVRKTATMMAEQLYERYCFQRTALARQFPFMMSNDVWKGGGRLQPNDEVGDVLKHGTLGIGFIGGHNAMVAIYGEGHATSKEAMREAGDMIPDGNKHAIRKEAREIFLESVRKTATMMAEQLYERYCFQRTALARQFPFMMSNDVWKGGGRLQPNDEVGDVLKHGTLGIGFIGGHNAMVAIYGEGHATSKEAWQTLYDAVTVMNRVVEEYKAKYGLNYSVLATPAEGLSGRFTRMDRKRYGEIPGVTDRDYYVNSFHVDVREPVSIVEKIRLEAPFHAITRGGHITYVELDGEARKNPVAILKIVKVMQDEGIGYGSINHPIDTCRKCGHRGVIYSKCPVCGSDDILRMRRITGYLTGSLESWNSAKQAEERDRVKHR